MPVPTDTFWNIRLLNRIFAASALILLLMMGGAVLLDYDKAWRVPQRSGWVWKATLAEAKASRTLTPEQQARLEYLNGQIRNKEEAIKPENNPEIAKLQEQIRQGESQVSRLEYEFNSLKASVQVDEAHLQDAQNDARTAEDRKRVAQMRDRLKPRQAEVARQDETIKARKIDLTALRTALAEQTRPVDELTKQKKKLELDRDALLKKRDALVPQTFLAKLSAGIRATPLMQFINPAEKVQQQVLPDVLTDVAFQKIPTVDRCTTCHVNIGDKDFAEDRLLGFLEQETAHVRKVEAPATANAGPTIAAPGAAALPEFWHNWAVKLTPAAVRKAAPRLKALTDTIGPIADVTYDGARLAAPFAYDPNRIDAKEIERQDAVVSELLKAWGHVGKWNPKDAMLDVVSTGPHATVRLHAAQGDKAVLDKAQKLGDDAVAAAMRYPDEVRSALQAALPADAQHLLLDRYRRRLIAEVNIDRKARGASALDDGAVMLAHPQLELYVDVDSPHSFEQVGCTSCHNGSGQETDFVLAAHTPRQIWVDQKTGEPVLPVQLTNPPKEKRLQTLSSMLDAVFPKDEVVPLGASNLHLKLNEPASQEPKAEPASVAEAPQKLPEHTAPTPYRDPVTGRQSKAVPQAQYWAATYERESGTTFEEVYHYWDWPMRPAEYIQANCVRCHTEVSDIREHAPVVYEGRTLFTNLGCVNCHQMDSIRPDSPPSKNVDAQRLIMANGQRKVGTDLRHVTSKLSPEFINTWIWAPKAFRPSTKMPHFFMLENNSSDEEIRRTRQEARAITEYLVQQASPLEIKYKADSSLKASVDAGRQVFETIGCQGCHTNLNNPTKTKGVTVGQQWITTDLVKSGDLARELQPAVEQQLQHDLVPKLTKNGKSPSEEELRKEVEKQLPAALTAKVQAEAKSRYAQMDYNERQLYLTEHLEPPAIMLEPPAALPGSPPVGPSGDVLEQARYPDGTPKPVFTHHGPELSGIGTKLLSARQPEQARAWLFDWLKEPRHYSDYTIMPRLRLSDQQAADLVEYLLDQKRTNDKKDDPWKAQLAEVDTPKQIELTAFFLRSRFSVNNAYLKADDDAELTKLAADALTTADRKEDEAAKYAKSLSKDQKRMVYLGKKLISHYGCMSCHAINGTETLTSPCANLSDWGQKSVDKLDYAYLDPHKREELPETTRIPMVNGLSVRAALLAGHMHPDVNNNTAGEKPAADVGDSQAGAEVIGVSLPEQPAPRAGSAQAAPGAVSAPVEVGWPEVEHLRESWLAQKLKNTRIWDRGRALLEPSARQSDDGRLAEPGRPYDKLKMPMFYLNDEQVNAIVTFVLSNRDRLVSERLLAKGTNDRAKMIAYGRQVTQKYNCINCHQIEQNVAGVQQYYPRDDIATKAPPSLRGEGNKIRHDWLFNFLKNVEPLRPLPVIRMPSFPITDEEASAVSAYFASVSNKEAEQLKKWIDPLDKYMDTARQQAEAARKMAAATQPTSAPSTMTASASTAPTTASTGPALADASAPGDDWWTQPAMDATRRQLATWALEHQQINRLQLDPDPKMNSPVQLAKNYKTVLFKARFTEDLYDTPYPFSEAPRPELSEQDFKRGESLFYEMQCLSCHALDGSRPGDKPPPGAKAPNLGLAQRRLQRRWIRHWVQEPPIIQAGTAMPPFFTGLSNFSQEGQPWPKSQGAAPEQVERVEARYGHTVEEQSGLLLDFLFAAGVRNYTAVQPPTPAGSAPQSPPMGNPPTATEPHSSGDPAPNGPANAPVEKVPTSGPGTRPADRGAEFQPSKAQPDGPPKGD